MPIGQDLKERDCYRCRSSSPNQIRSPNVRSSTQCRHNSGTHFRNDCSAHSYWIVCCRIPSLAPKPEYQRRPEWRPIKKSSLLTSFSGLSRVCTAHRGETLSWRSICQRRNFQSALRLLRILANRVNTRQPSQAFRSPIDLLEVSLTTEVDVGLIATEIVIKVTSHLSF